VTFIKDAVKNVLISSIMSMSDDSFTFKSLTTEYILSNNEISYLLKSLIDINEVIMQIVCDQLQIKFLTLIKAKLI